MRGWVDLDMRRYLPLLLFIGLAWGQEEYYIEHIFEQDGVYKKMFSEEIVNGNIYDLNDDMDIEIPLGQIINGLKEGFWTDWYINGRIKSKINWKNGQISGTGYNYRWDGTLECQIEYVNESDYTKTFYDEDGNPDGTSMEYQSGKMYDGREKTSYIYIETGSKQPIVWADPMIQYFEKGKHIKTEFFSKKTGELVKITRIWKYKRFFQFVFTPIIKSKFFNRACIGIVTIFYSLLA